MTAHHVCEDCGIVFPETEMDDGELGYWICFSCINIDNDDDIDDIDIDIGEESL